MRAILMANAVLVPTLLLGMFSVAGATEPYSRAVLEQKLEKEYPLTAVNAEGAVVTQGAAFLLKKSGLTAGSLKKCVNEYNNGRISAGGNVLSRCIKLPGVAAGAELRTFVAGERLSIEKIEVKDSVAVGLISDPISDVRYRAELRFAFPKGTTPDLDRVDQLIGEVFTPAPAESPQAPAAQGDPGAAAGASSLPPIPPPPPPDPSVTAPIAPPPPPPDQPAAPPQTLSLGQTIDQVIAILGQPAAVADLGAKKIYTYKNPSLKVTFVNGKVTDMQ
jgi:hypothetical protein